MTQFRILLPLLFPVALFGQNTKTTDEWYQIEDSEIHILGTSNVTDYRCILHDLSNNSDLQIQSKTSGYNINLQNAIITLNSEGFNCDNAPMTRDFLKAIKASKYPHIYIEFLSFKLNNYIEEKHVQNHVIATIAVTLAGVRKVYTLELESLIFAMDSVTVKGQKEIKMTEFNIDPPTAMFGLVKANDIVTIDFSIVFNLK